MSRSTIFGALVFAAVAIGVAPTHVMSQSTTQKVEQKTWAIDTSDEDITRRVEDRLSQDARLTKVGVRTDGGAVILTGAVPSIGASARASELARGVPGVRSVKNELTYEPGPMDGIVGPRTASALRLGTTP